ncbi:MAG: serine protease [Lachnospiraceae bacterium]|nr:serine protease [Lachnospiraceae bacterium]
MKKKRLNRYILCLSVFLFTLRLPLRVKAEDSQAPHLIQTVTEQDIFEGKLALGFLESPVSATGDCGLAYENVKNCIVRIHMGNAYGSGVVFQITPENVIIVTNKHVLSYWDDTVSYVQFPQGYFTQARLLGTSAEHDIGFLAVDNQEFDYRELEQLRYVHWDLDRYQAMQAGDALFCTGAGDEMDADGTDSFYQGSVGDMNYYIDDFGEYMIYGYGYAREGMSGGGTFDSYGNFIGMISGATMSGETASVPLPAILEAYGGMIAK